MAHITEFRIGGLLGRSESVHFKLNPGVNIFFGENGCGKTTLLKVLDAALSRDGAAMEPLPVARAAVDIYSIDEKRTLKHVWERREASTARAQLDLSLGDFAETLDGRGGREIGGEGTEWTVSPAPRLRRAARWAHTFLPTTRLYFGANGPRWTPSLRSELSEAELEGAFSESVNRAWLQFYSRTLNAVRSIQESGFRDVLRQVLNPATDSAKSRRADPEVYARVANFLRRQSESDSLALGSEESFRARYAKDANLRQIVDRLDEVERQIEAAMIPVNRFLEEITHLFSGGKSLKLTNNELQVLLANERVLSISHLSSGEKHLIKILLSAMTAGPNSVLIDEPELSMHIDWQRRFVQTIRSLNPGCQLILASHSPEVMADVADDCIFKP